MITTFLAIVMNSYYYKKVIDIVEYIPNGHRDPGSSLRKTIKTFSRHELNPTKFSFKEVSMEDMRKKLGNCRIVRQWTLMKSLLLYSNRTWK